MRIRKSSHNSRTSPSSSSSSSSSYSSSSITNNSLASSTDSSSSAPSTTSITRCQGLDLLVKAIYQVTDGSVVGVPYIQRRVIRRRRRRTDLSFGALGIVECSLMKRKQQRTRLKPNNRRVHRSAKTCEELGF